MISLTSYLYSADFTVDGILYNVLNENEVEVTYEKNESGYNASTYVGDIVVPETVTYRGMTFKVTQIGKYAFAGCKMNSVELPNSITSIDVSAFSSCRVSKLFLPNSIENIGDYCCADMMNVEELHLPENEHVTNLPFHSFRGMRNLLELKIPTNICRLGSCAFSGAKSLKRLVFHENLWAFGASCFADCTGLEEIEFLSPNVSISYYSFRACTNLKTVKFWHSQCVLEGFPDCDVLESVIVYDEIAHPIADNSFSEGNYLFVNLYVPENSIEQYKECDGWKKFKNIKPLNLYTGITPITVKENSIIKYFDLQGNYTSHPQKGIYIKQEGDNTSKVYFK